MSHEFRRNRSAISTMIRELIRQAALPALAAAAAALAAPVALAQEPPAPAGASGQQTAQAANSGELQEVVVTARYRAENLQSTPLSITAITAQDLQQQQLVNVNDLGNTIPNAYFRQPTSNYGPTETIGLRGFTQTDFNYAFQPTVGFYIDDVYQGTLTGSSFDLADLQRVEVLNGPQGTLFGMNSIGGAIRLITNKPNNTDSASVQLTYGEHHRTDVVGIANLSLIDHKLMMRVVGVSRSEDSIGHYLDFACEMRAIGAPASVYGSLPQSTTLGMGTGCALGGLGGFNHQNARVELRYLPTDKLELNVKAYYTKQDDDPPLQTLLSPYGGPHDILNNIYDGVVFKQFGMNYTNNPYLVSPNPWDNYASFGDISTGQAYNPKSILNESGVSATADYDVTDSIHAKYIWAYRTYQTNWASDSDLTPFGLIGTNYLQEHRQFQNELRLTGTAFGDRLQWTLGGFYYDARDLEADTTMFAAFNYLGILHNNYVTTGYTNNNQSGFFHLNYKLTDKWSLSGGWRYTSQYLTNNYVMQNAVATQTLLSLPAPVQISGSRGDWSGSINFQATPDLFFYTEAASGFTLPGFNSRVETIGQLEEPVPGQEAVNYELGFKTDWLDHRLRVNGSFFYEDYKSYLLLELATQCNPVSDLNPGTPIFGLPAGAACPAGTGLAGKPGLSPWFYYAGIPAYMPGAELEVNAEPIDRLLVNFEAGWIRFYDKITDPTNPGYINRSVRLQPEWNMSAGVQYGIRFSNGGTLTPRLDWRYQGYMTNGPDNVYQIQPDFIIPGYSLFNASLTYAPDGDSWEVALQAQNLFNKFYWEQLGAASALTVPGPVGAPTAGNLYATPERVGTPGLPREWMITITKNF